MIGDKFKYSSSCAFLSPDYCWKRVNHLLTMVMHCLEECKLDQAKTVLRTVSIIHHMNELFRLLA